MRRFFDLWSADTKPLGINNFERMTKFLLSGRVLLCRDLENCCKGFFAVRWNGSVYPCTEFGGEPFEKLYCYGNLLRDGWEAIRDASNRGILLTRHERLREIGLAGGGCGDCRYWDGCHGGCMHQVMREEYKWGRDSSPQRIAGIRDYVACDAVRGLYGYIETQMRKKAGEHRLPLLLYLDSKSSDRNRRRAGFYDFQKNLHCVCQTEDKGSRPAFSGAEAGLLSRLLGRFRSLLFVCCGGSEVCRALVREGQTWHAVDYAGPADNDVHKVGSPHDLEACSDIVAWEGWQRGKVWEAVVLNPCMIWGEELPEVLRLVASVTVHGGGLFVWSRVWELGKANVLEVTDLPGIRGFDGDAIALNVRELSVARLNGSGLPDRRSGGVHDATLLKERTQNGLVLSHSPVGRNHHAVSPRRRRAQDVPSSVG